LIWGVIGILCTAEKPVEAGLAREGVGTDNISIA
jgi:hypothetical protein